MADRPTYDDLAADRDRLRAALTSVLGEFKDPGMLDVLNYSSASVPMEVVTGWRHVLDVSSRNVEDNHDILDTVTGLVPPEGDVVSLWSAEPAVVAGFIAAVVSAAEQTKRMTPEEATGLPDAVAKGLGTLHGAVKTLLAAYELAAYPQRLVFSLGPDQPEQSPRAEDQPLPSLKPSHTCVSLPTERARRLGVLAGTRAELGKTVETAERIADDVALMRRRQLCLSCGYPLDNSAPHPLARKGGAPSNKESV